MADRVEGMADGAAGATPDDRRVPDGPSRSPRRSLGLRMLRWVLLAVVMAAVVVLLFEVVFPWVEVNYYDPSMG